MASEITMFLLAFVVAVSLVGSVAVTLGIALFGGATAKRREDVQRPAASPRVEQHAPTFFEWHPPNLAIPDEVLLRQIEHHLRREALIAEHFIQNPSAETLRAAEDQVRVH